MHIPVLLGEAMEWLAIRPEGVYVDATVGAGGHARRILESLTTGRLIALDRDPAAIEIALENLSAHQRQLTLVQENFAYLPRLLRQIGVTVVDGILADLGLSQMQIDIPERGFSLRGAGPLDTRGPPSGRSPARLSPNHRPRHLLRPGRYQFGEER